MSETAPNPLVDGEAEQAVLGAMLLSSDDPAVIAIARKLVPSKDYFFHGRNRIAYKAFCELLDKGVKLDTLTVRDHLQGQGLLDEAGGVDAIATLSDAVPTSANVEFHSQIVRDLYDRRVMVSRGERLISMAKDRKIPAHEAVAETVTELARATVHIKGRSPKRWIAALLDAAESVEARAKKPGGLDGIPTLLTDLDRVLGGAKPGELIILAARPSIGKSSLMLRMVRNAAVHFYRSTPDGEPLPTAVIASLEMSIEKLVTRLLAAEADIALGRLMRDGVLSDQAVTRIVEAQNKLSRLPVYCMDSATHDLRSPGHIRMAIEHLQAVEGSRIGYLAIDYLQYLQGDVKRDSRNQELGEITKALKLMGMQMGFPILLLAQLNRESEKSNRKPRTSDLRDSGEIEQDADKIILLHAEPKSSEWDPQLVEVDVAKNRDGDTGVVSLSFDKATQKWRLYTTASHGMAKAS